MFTFQNKCPVLLSYIQTTLVALNVDVTISLT